MKHFISLLAVLLLFSNLVFCQTRKISGQVKDEKGDPVPFASVKLQGTNKGTSADANGLFSLDIGQTQNAVLVISSQGFKEQSFSVGDKSFIDAQITSTGQQLAEVVVSTALGIQRSKNKLPYAAQVVGSEDLTRSRSSNFLDNLSGRVSGLDIKQSNVLGGSTNVVLRGNKSISFSNQALFVVDGVPYDNTATASPGGQRGGRGGYDYGNAAADINPDDIESVTVLKGPAASALYGSRGFNGVIVITTKKAKKGLGITINSGITHLSADKKTFPTYQKQYGGGYGPYYEDATGFFLYRDPSLGYSYTGGAGSVLIVPTSEDASFGGKFDPNLMVYQWDAFDPNSPNFGKAKPWVAATNDPWKFLQHPINYNNSIFIESAHDKGSFKLGYTRTDDKGILPNSKITKDLVTFSSTHNITSNLTAGATLNYDKVKGLGRYGTGYDDKNPMSSFRQWWEVNNDILELKDAYLRNHQNVTWNWADPTDLVPIYWDNPWFTRYENFENDARNRYFGNVSLNYKITSWLNIMGRISMDKYDELQEERIAVGSIGVSQYSRNNRNRNETNYDLLATFDRNITKDLNLKGLVGSNIRVEKFSNTFASTNGGLVVPKLYSLTNSANPINAPSEFVYTKEVDGYFAGITLGYKDFATLDATIRRDASSTLPKGSNVYYYPSVSGGFIFSSFLKNVDWLSYGKLRGNYAEVGNDAPVYSIDNTYVSIPSFGSQTLFALPTTSANNELVPERNKSWEVGLEMAFLKSRAGFDLTYYDAQAVNQIIPVSVSRATGFNQKFINSGEVENKGVELSVFGTPVKTKNFSWTVNLNWTRNRNKVVELFDDGAGNKIDNIVLNSYQGGVTLNATLGQPYGVIKGKDFTYFGDAKNEKRDPSMRIVGANGRYVQTAAANYIIGDPNPDWTGGIQNSFKYKNLSAGFLIDVRQGGDIFSLDMYYGLGTGLYPETVYTNDLGNPVRNSNANGGGFIRPGVTAAGVPNTVRVSANNYTAFGWAYAPPAMFIYDGSFVKLREASLGYSLPASLLSKLGVIKGIDLSLVGRNLWIIHKNLPYSDPEESYGSGNTANGYQGNAYPATRHITFNVKVKF